MQMQTRQHERQRMVDVQVGGRGVTEAEVLAAMREVPREMFVPEGLAEFAYEDSPLPIDESQTISQPYIVGLMIEAAGVKPGTRVLEIGAGSGYAAAVMSRIAAEVYTIERIGRLADQAEARLRALGYDNVQVRTGDGTHGWPEAAPFDAIIAAAGGPDIPESLAGQLAVGASLVMPVGEEMRRQRLVKLTRRDAATYEREDLGEVMFVPLIGEHGWREEAGVQARRRPAEPRSFREPVRERRISELIAAAAEPLPDPDTMGFGLCFDRFADARVVLLGEASHGTSEFYRARAMITRRLIEAHGFNIVAVEADWPDAAAIDRHVRFRRHRRMADPPFSRFPTWMWRNQEVEGFVGWMRDHNRFRPDDRRAGFYGLDLYSLNASMRAVIDYLERVDPEAAAVARARYGCLMPWSREPQAYGRMALTRGYSQCESAVAEMLTELLRLRLEEDAHDGLELFDAQQNARLVQDAEAYYRVMYYGSAESWNLRDRHMFETLQAVLEHKGPEAKAVVWAHNSHIGDARFTEMGVAREELNIGQLCRQAWGRDAALIGFGTHTGTVACADDWDEPMKVKRVNPSRPDSYERMAHDTRLARFLLDLREGEHEALRHRLLQPQLERFIGVIYRPDTERWSHYSECSLPRQFDAYVWFDETHAVTPLPTEPRQGEDETYPFGV
jgi:protein-L-isoaspartate(D-aspartate) O-methyltransferase